MFGRQGRVSGVDGLRKAGLPEEIPFARRIVSGRDECCIEVGAPPGAWPL
jgi:hypothetical protein